MPRNNSSQDTAEVLAQIRLKIERAKLAKLEADLPKPTPQYTRYEDMPAPSTEERARIIARIRELYERVNREAAEKERQWYLSMVDKAP